MVNPASLPESYIFSSVAKICLQKTEIKTKNPLLKYNIFQDLMFFRGFTWDGIAKGKGKGKKKK